MRLILREGNVIKIVIIKEERTVDIDYSILAKYHVNAELIWEVKKERNQSPQTVFNFFRIFNFDHLNGIKECEQEAQDIYEMLGEQLNIYNISEHNGNLIFIIVNHLELEGSLFRDQSEFIALSNSKLAPLLRLLKIRDTGLLSDIKIEFAHKNHSNRNFPEYTMIDDLSTIDKLVDVAITAMFQDIKIGSDNIDPMLSFILEDITTPTYDNINNLVGNLSNISRKTSDSLLLYTIISEVGRYLTDETDMNPDKSDITNDQARVIYVLLVYFDLINKENHDIDLDRTGYIRAILNNNRKRNTPLLKSTIDQVGTDLFNSKLAKPGI